MPEDKRKVEVYDLLKREWTPLPEFKAIKAGMIFRLFEPDTNEPVKDGHDATEFFAKADARLIGDTKFHMVDVRPAVGYE